MEHDKKLGAWLRAEFCKAKPPHKLFLRTAAPGARGTNIEEWQPVKLELEELPTLGNEILQRAQDDADGNGPSIHRYVIHAMDKGESKPRAKYSFRLRGESDIDLDDEEGGEAPTQKGLMTQLMRHNEAIMRTNQSGMTSLIGMMVRRLEASDNHIEQLIKERREHFSVLEAAQSEASNRDMQAMIEMKNQDRKDLAFQKLMTLAPLVVNKIVGSKILPDKSDPLMMMLEPLIGSMSGEQLQAIQSTLNMEQTIMFVELLSAFQKRKQISAPSGDTKKEN